MKFDVDALRYDADHGHQFFRVLIQRVKNVTGFFFSSRRRHTIFKCDWSSDVCSSDLDRDVDLIPHVASALGVQVTAYGVGEKLKPTYGSRPAGIAVFVRIRPFSR